MGVESIELGGEFGVHDHPPLNTQNYCEKTYEDVLKLIYDEEYVEH